MEVNKESLLEIAHRYFTRKGLDVAFNVDTKKIDGKMQKLDMVASDHSGKVGILVTNWDRSIGVNVIRKLSRIIQATELKDGILIGDSFSEHCRQFAKDYKVQLLSRSKMLQEMDEL